MIAFGRLRFLLPVPMLRSAERVILPQAGRTASDTGVSNAAVQLFEEEDTP